MYLLSGAFWDRGWKSWGCVDFYAGAWRGRDGTAAVPYGVVWSALSFPLCPELNTGDPFGANAPLPLAGAALRGKGFGFRADLGSAPRQ